MTLATRESVTPKSPLAEWATSAMEAATVARELVRTPFVPASLRAARTSREQTEEDLADVTAANVTAAILTGAELGLSPMASLRSIDVIQGVPAMRAVTLRAVVLAAGHDIWVEESTATRAIVAGCRKGSDQVQRSTWTIDRARGLNLLGKDNWRKQPAAMLIARATAECARLIAADAILGIPYSFEELDDGIDTADHATTAAESQSPRTAKRRSAQPRAISRTEPPAAAAAPEPGFDDEPASSSKDAAGAQPDSESGEASRFDPGPESGTQTITEPQLKKLHASFADVGITGRNDRLRLAAAVCQREIGSTSDLTLSEASRLIEALTTGTWQTYTPGLAELINGAAE